MFLALLAASQVAAENSERGMMRKLLVDQCVPRNCIKPYLVSLFLPYLHGGCVGFF